VLVAGLVVLRLAGYGVAKALGAARRREAAFNQRVASLTPAGLTQMEATDDGRRRGRAAK
jgi:hypothetical protein